MLYMTQGDVLDLNLKLVGGDGGVNHKDEGDKNFPILLAKINTNPRPSAEKAAEVALATVTLQIFRDGNHRTALLLLYYLMLADSYKPRKTALQLYAKMILLKDGYEHGDTDQRERAISDLAQFADPARKNWRDGLGALTTIIPHVIHELERLPAKLALVESQNSRYTARENTLIPKKDIATGMTTIGSLQARDAFAAFHCAQGKDFGGPARATRLMYRGPRWRPLKFHERGTPGDKS